MSSKFALVVVLAELATQMRAEDLELDLQWIPRNQNEHADAITNGRTGALDPALRIQVEVAALPFIVLNEMMAVTDHSYREVRAKTESKPVPATRATSGGGSRKRPLRETDPW